MKIARWMGRRAAELMMILRDKPMIPCQIEWDYRNAFVDPLINPPHWPTPSVTTRARWDDEEGDISVDILGEWGKPR